MSDDMIERVARAMCERYAHQITELQRSLPTGRIAPNFKTWDDASEIWKDLARAGIEAMREHIEENFERAILWEGHVQHVNPVGEGWNQCLDEIDSALTPPK